MQVCYVQNTPRGGGGYPTILFLIGKAWTAHSDREVIIAKRIIKPSALYVDLPLRCCRLDKHRAADRKNTSGVKTYTPADHEF